MGVVGSPINTVPHLSSQKKEGEMQQLLSCLKPGLPLPKLRLEVDLLEIFPADVNARKHWNTKYVTDKYHQFQFKKNEQATHKLESMEMHGSSLMRGQGTTVCYSKTGEAGRRLKESSQELHKSRTQPLPGSQSENRKIQLVWVQEEN